MTDPLVIVDAKNKTYVPMADWERQRRKNRVFRECLADIAQRLNRMADEIEAEQAHDWHATDTAPLTDTAP